MDDRLHGGPAVWQLSVSMRYLQWTEPLLNRTPVPDSQFSVSSGMTARPLPYSAAYGAFDDENCLCCLGLHSCKPGGVCALEKGEEDYRYVVNSELLSWYLFGTPEGKVVRNR